MSAPRKPLLNFGGHKATSGGAETTPDAGAPEGSAETAPLLSVVSGNPTEEEIAAVVAVVGSMQKSRDQHDYSALALWQRRLNRGQRLGTYLRPGPGSWRRARPQ